MEHHTKDKGDKGLGFVIADLLKNGIQPAILLSEHLPFDCVAINVDMKVCLLSVKYRTAKDGRIEVHLKSSWTDKHGTHIKRPDLTAFDAVAVYCPDTGKVYYLRISDFDGQISFVLRIGLTKNNQKNGVRLASDFENPARIFT